jgi:hypothetical protein
MPLNVPTRGISQFPIRSIVPKSSCNASPKEVLPQVGVEDQMVVSGPKVRPHPHGDIIDPLVSLHAIGDDALI